MKQMFGVIAMLLLCGGFGYSQNMQTSVNVRPLKIGDTIPDVLIEKISNYKSSNIRFSEFKGKLVILDFWFGLCKGCYIAFPKLEALQKKFKDRIQVIAVNFESQEKIDSTFKKWGRTADYYRGPKVASIVNDSVFHGLFSFKYYPHEVWIDGDGIVRAFTTADAVTEENINALLENRVARMDMKIDNFSFDANKPALPQIYPTYPTQLKYYSALLNYVEGISFGAWVKQVIDSSAGTVRVTRKNRSIIQLFSDALFGGYCGDPYESAMFDFGKRVMLIVKDSARYLYSETSNETKGEWQAKNCYTFETVYPLSQQKVIDSLRLLELKRFFDLNCRIEKRKMKCWSLIRTSEQDKIRTKSPTTVSVFNIDPDFTKLQLRGSTTQWLVDKISEANKNSPYIFSDNTGYEGRIDIKLTKASMNKLSKLREELRTNYDLDLIENVQEMDVLVFEEKDFTSKF